MSDEPASLARLAYLARGREKLLASLFSFYQENEGLSDGELAAFLQCSLNSLARLALCRRPRSAPYFRQDVEQITKFVSANPFQLMRLIRSAESQQALRMKSSSTMLLAARDEEATTLDDDTTPGSEESYLG